MKPLIGITAYFVSNKEFSEKRIRGLPGQDMIMSSMDYSEAIEKAGGIPVTIPVINNEKYVDEIVEKLDGILLSGGPDIHPKNYHKIVEEGLGLVVLERDEFELKVLEKALGRNKPILGVCRGLQLINIFFGGTLCQDINTYKPTGVEHLGSLLCKENFVHKVILQKGSKVYKALKQRELGVNSFHHQMIVKLGKDLTVSALSEDGIIEGIEHEGYLYVVGVQWHPEMMCKVFDEQLNIFKQFIDRASSTPDSDLYKRIPYIVHN